MPDLSASLEELKVKNNSTLEIYSGLLEVKEEPDEKSDDNQSRLGRFSDSPKMS